MWKHTFRNYAHAGTWIHNTERPLNSILCDHNGLFGSEKRRTHYLTLIICYLYAFVQSELVYLLLYNRQTLLNFTFLMHWIYEYQSKVNTSQFCQKMFYLFWSYYCLCCVILLLRWDMVTKTLMWEWQIRLMSILMQQITPQWPPHQSSC